MSNKPRKSIKLWKISVFSSLLLFLIFATQLSLAQNVFPGKTWEKTKNPEELGYSLEKLQAAREFADKGKTAAVVIVVNGKILYEWGEVEKDFITHSTRKSFLSALYGKYVKNGTIDLDMTMKELGIDDVTPLSELEKMATIRDCLKARSGVYIDAAAESPGMRSVKPARNSRALTGFITTGISMSWERFSKNLPAKPFFRGSWKISPSPSKWSTWETMTI